MLHHANVDRLYAMWQAINFNDTVFTTTQRGNALFGTAAGPITADSPLRPFYSTSSSTGGPVFHTSRSVESISSFGYTYPEINDWSLAPADLANTVRAAVNNLYGPQASSTSIASSKKKARTISNSLLWKLPSVRRRRNAGRAVDHDMVGDIVKPASNDINVYESAVNNWPFPIHNAPILESTEFNIEIGVDRSQLPLPCTIELHLAGAGSSSGSSSSSSSSSSGDKDRNKRRSKIGGTSILSMPKTGMSYSTTPLRRILVGEATRNVSPAVFNDSENVLAHLRGLGVVIRTVCIFEKKIKKTIKEVSELLMQIYSLTEPLCLSLQCRA